MARANKENLMLKIRVIPLVRMRKSELLRQLKRAVRTGVVPPDIEVEYMDWAKGSPGRRIRSGTIDGREWDELRKFYNAITSATRIRVERAD